MGLPDWGRCRLYVHDGRVEIHSGASCIGQGLGTVLVQMLVEQLGLTREQVFYDASNTYNAPDGYATQVCILDEKGRVEKIVAAHDVGRAVNPLSIEGQIEGGVIMSAGFALTEEYGLKDCAPQNKYGTLGLFRAHQAPEVESIIVEKPGLSVAEGAIGIGEITSIPTAPAIAGAYYRYDGEYRTSLPLVHTPYERKKKGE